VEKEEVKIEEDVEKVENQKDVEEE